MRYKTILAMIVLAAFMTPALAQAVDFTPARWWRIPKLADQVKLTEQDKKQLDNVFLDNRKKLRDLKDDVEDQQEALEDMICVDPLNEAAVMSQFRKLDKARSDLAEAAMVYNLQIRKIIGAERFKAVAEIAKIARKGRKNAANPDKD
jgi:Spy/CpxP family protein refolding chaperone